MGDDIAAIVLAAGESRRMGVPKLLLPYGDTTILGAVTRALRETGLQRIIVVVGRNAGGIRDALRGQVVAFTTNPAPENGMLTSVQCGIRAAGAADGYLIALGDQPMISANVVSALVAAFQRSTRGIVVASHGGKRGHPAIFRGTYRDEIQALPPTAGLNVFQHCHVDDIELVKLGDASILDDIDTPEDYRRIAGTWPGDRKP